MQDADLVLSTLGLFERAEPLSVSLSLFDFGENNSW